MCQKPAHIGHVCVHVISLFGLAHTRDLFYVTHMTMQSPCHGKRDAVSHGDSRVTPRT